MRRAVIVRLVEAALILAPLLAGCWLAPTEPAGPDDPAGWERTKWWTGHARDRQVTDPFTVSGPWAVEWELSKRVDASGFSRLKVELLDAEGKLVDRTIDTKEARSGHTRYSPGTYKLRIEPSGSSTREWSVSWRVAVREKNATPRRGK
jgi:hypothetical protein